MALYIELSENKPVHFNKEDIESAKISFREKLTDVIPQLLSDNSFWNKNLIDKENILELYENRRNIIHLKTNSQDDFECYFSAIDKMLDLDISTSINSTIKFMNLTTTNFVEIDIETTI